MICWKESFSPGFFDWQGQRARERVGEATLAEVHASAVDVGVIEEVHSCAPGGVVQRADLGVVLVVDAHHPGDDGGGVWQGKGSVPGHRRDMVWSGCGARAMEERAVKLTVSLDVDEELLDRPHQRRFSGPRIADQQDVRRRMTAEVFDQRDRHLAQRVVLPDDRLAQLLEDVFRPEGGHSGADCTRWRFSSRWPLAGRSLLTTGTAG